MDISESSQAAVFLLSLPKEQVVLLLARLQPEQIAAVTAEMERLGENPTALCRRPWHGSSPPARPTPKIARWPRLRPSSSFTIFLATISCA